MTSKDVPVISGLLRTLGRIKRRFNRPRLSDLVFLAILWLISLGVVATFMVLISSNAEGATLTSGDRVNLVIADGDELSGQYQLNQAGALELPHLGAVSISGMEPPAAARKLTDALVDAKLFKPGRAQVSLQVLEWASVDVFVSGEVYLPGRVRLNQAPSRDRAPDAKPDLPGARTPERRLSDALRTAGGIRTTADLEHVELRHKQGVRLFNLRGLLTGDAAEDPQLEQGDQVVLHSTGKIDASMARPSILTPPGIRVLASNLTTPAMNNTASTVDHGSLSLPYGSRLSQGVVAANCSGGTYSTNAGRYSVLTRTDRLSGNTQRWTVAIEDLLHSTAETQNPILQEGDGITCYDSGVTAVRDIFRALADIVLPFRSLR